MKPRIFLINLEILSGLSFKFLLLPDSIITFISCKPAALENQTILNNLNLESTFVLLVETGTSYVA